MEEKDLMVGSLVSFNGECVSIREIDSCGYCTINFADGMWLPIDPLFDLSPLLIDSSILSRNGWKNIKNDDSLWVKDNVRLLLYIRPDGSAKVVWRDNPYSVCRHYYICRSVSELQAFLYRYGYDWEMEIV